MRNSRAGRYEKVDGKTVFVPPTTWEQQKALDKRKRSMKYRSVTRKFKQDK